MAYPRIRRGINLSLTNKLIIVNVVLFILFYLAGLVFGNDLVRSNIALTPSLILKGQNLWTLFTSMFAHGNIFHLFVNMFSLFFVGNSLERLIGSRRLILVYLASGLMGGLFFVASGLIFGDNTPGVGASGAIFGILGVLATLVPYSRIYLILGPLILIILYMMMDTFVPAYLIPYVGMLINILIILMIFSLLSFNPRLMKLAVPLEMQMWILPIVAIVPLVLIDFFIELPIGNSAHIGGLVLGVIYGFYLRTKFPRKTKIISNYFR